MPERTRPGRTWQVQALVQKSQGVRTLLLGYGFEIQLDRHDVECLVCRSLARFVLAYPLCFPSPRARFIPNEEPHKIIIKHGGEEFVVPVDLTLGKRTTHGSAADRVLHKRLKERLLGAPVFRPRPQQTREYNRMRALDRPYDSGGRALIWGMGACKSRAAVYTIYALNPLPSLCFVLCPLTMCDLWVDEIKGVPAPATAHLRFDVLAHGAFERILDTQPKWADGRVCVIDEIQQFRNLTGPMQFLLRGVQKCSFNFVLTGTPIQNRRADLLASAWALKRIPSQKTLEKEPWRTWLQELDESEEEPSEEWLTALEHLTKAEVAWITTTFQDLISFYTPNEDGPDEMKRYPEKHVEVVKVPMEWSQSLDYVVTRNQSSPWLGKRIGGTAGSNCFSTKSRRICATGDENSTHYKPVDVADEARAAARQGPDPECATPPIPVSSSTEAAVEEEMEEEFVSPKLREMVKRMAKCGQWPQVVYDPYLERGIVAAAECIRKALAPVEQSMLMGKTNTNERTTLLREYNTKSSKRRTLCFSRIGSVGLSLFRTRMLHMLEAEDSPESGEQVENRVYRLDSHSDVDPHVWIVRYISVFPDVAELKLDPKLVEYLLDHFHTHYCDDASLDDRFVAEFVRKIVEENRNRTIDERRETRNRLKRVIARPIMDLFNEMHRAELKKTQVPSKCRKRRRARS